MSWVTREYEPCSWLDDNIKVSVLVNLTGEFTTVPVIIPEGIFEEFPKSKNLNNFGEKRVNMDEFP